MRKANGAGSIYKMKGRRRNPWRVMVTVGWKYDSKDDYVPERRTIGYFRTRADAEDALADYRKNPYDLDARKLTFAEVYEKWSAVHFEKVSIKAVRNYRMAYNHSAPLHGMTFADIRPAHLDECIRSVGCGSATKIIMRTLYGMMYKWAIKNGMCQTNYAALCDTIERGEPSRKRTTFTEGEEGRLWEEYEKGTPYVDMILIQMYSGWRPKELCLLEVSDVDLSGKTFKGGIKTKAGKDRIVPIHPQVLPLVLERIGGRTGGKLFEWSPGNGVKYSTYLKYFTSVMGLIGASHAPHDARHTFITKAKEADMDEYVLKLVVGHAIADLTEKVYTHRGIERLGREIAKIPIFHDFKA